MAADTWREERRQRWIGYGEEDEERRRRRQKERGKDVWKTERKIMGGKTELRSKDFPKMEFEDHRNGLSRCSLRIFLFSKVDKNLKKVEGGKDREESYKLEGANTT